MRTSSSSRVDQRKGDDELSLFFNGDTIRLKHLPGGHSDSDVVVIFEAARVVAVGGMVFGGGFPGIGTGGTPEKLADNLQWILDQVPDDATVITGHGALYSTEDLAAYVEMLRKTTAIVVAALARGDDAEAIKSAGLLAAWSRFDRPFLDVDGWVDAIVASRTPPEPDLRTPLVGPLHRVLQTDDVAAAVALYRELKATAADEYAFTEGALNAIGYYLLGKGRVDEAITIFALNVEEYPEAFNTYDSLAEGYMIRGDRELAIRNYQQSLALNPDNTNAENKLAELAQGGAHTGAGEDGV